jgi:exodeoxyribonuclease VII large subunit
LDQSFDIRGDMKRKNSQSTPSCDVNVLNVGGSPGHVYTPSTFADELRVEGPGVSYVRGEVVSLYAHSNGHVFFELKDSTKSISCTAWTRQCSEDTLRLLRRCSSESRVVVVRGQARIEKFKQCKLSFVVTKAFTDDTRARSIVKEWDAAIEKAGLYRTSRKLVLPKVLHRIAVVTSNDGAVIKDMRSVFARHRSVGSLMLFACNVQGANCTRSIISALGEIRKRCDTLLDNRTERPRFDCVCIIRGGGSFEDLLEYNNPSMCQAVDSFRATTGIPVVCAIGHADDSVHLDRVVDVTHITPTAAAHALVEPMLAIQRRMTTQFTRARVQTESLYFRAWATRTQRLARRDATMRRLVHRRTTRMHRDGFGAIVAWRDVCRSRDRLTAAAGKAVACCTRRIEHTCTAAAFRVLADAAAAHREHDQALAAAGKTVARCTRRIEHTCTAAAFRVLADAAAAHREHAQAIHSLTMSRKGALARCFRRRVRAKARCGFERFRRAVARITSAETTGRVRERAFAAAAAEAAAEAAVEAASFYLRLTISSTRLAVTAMGFVEEAHVKSWDNCMVSDDICLSPCSAKQGDDTGRVVLTATTIAEMSTISHEDPSRYSAEVLTGDGRPVDASTITDPSFINGNTLLLSFTGGRVFRVFYQHIEPLSSDGLG